jgi:hypothetical protein
VNQAARIVQPMYSAPDNFSLGAQLARLGHQVLRSILVAIRRSLPAAGPTEPEGQLGEVMHKERPHESLSQPQLASRSPPSESSCIRISGVGLLVARAALDDPEPCCYNVAFSY